MELNEKLAILRKNAGYTQDDLAEMLEVTRQSVSRWENGAAIPETEKLIKLSRIYGCTLDHLINDTPPSGELSQKRTFTLTINTAFKERRSQRTVKGLPLWHIGKNARGIFAVGLNARGVVAVGLFARGIISLGCLSLGVISFGGLCLGIIACGLFCIGLAAFGCIAAGLFAAGAIAVGLLSFGAIAVGEFSAGALAIGKYYAQGDRAYAMIAVGKTYAEGSVFQKTGELTADERVKIAKLLNELTPSLLVPLKNIIIKII